METQEWECEVLIQIKMAHWQQFSFVSHPHPHPGTHMDKMFAPWYGVPARAKLIIMLLMVAAVSCVAESQDTGSSTSASSKMMAQDINEYVIYTSNHLFCLSVKIYSYVFTSLTVVTR